jgi:hypothetical protein
VATSGKMIGSAFITEPRHVHGNGETGFYRPTDLLVKPYTNLAVTVPNHPFFEKTGIFE